MTPIILILVVVFIEQAFTVSPLFVGFVAVAVSVAPLLLVFISRAVLAILEVTA